MTRSDGNADRWRGRVRRPNVDTRMKQARLLDKRIDDGQTRESAEIAVRGPERLHAMLQTQGRDTCVVNDRPGDRSAEEKLAVIE